MNDFNFENDLKTQIIKVSSSIGFKVAESKKLDEMLLDYLTVRRKIIEPKPRKVFINPLFKIDIQLHPKRHEIEFIIKQAYEGKSLNNFQSKRLLEANFHDHLQNEWNIFHFHLSFKKEKKSNFAKQVNALLFAYVEDSQIIFLGTDIHREGIFGDIKWIGILHDFFPNTIVKYLHNQSISIYPKVNAFERQMLWNKGYSLGMTEVRGHIYKNPGIGRVLTGHSLNNAITTDKILDWMYKLTEQLHDSFEMLCRLLEIDINKAKFKIRFGNETLELIEEETQKKLLEFPYILADKRAL